MKIINDWTPKSMWGEHYLQCPHCLRTFKIIDVLGKPTELSKITMRYCPACGNPVIYPATEKRREDQEQ